MHIKRIRGIEEANIYYVLTVVFCANFLGRGSVFCMLFALLSLFRMPGRIAFDADMLYALILCVASFFASVLYTDMIEAIKCLNFFLMYLVGLNGYYAAVNRIAYLKKTIFAVYLGFTLNLILIFYSSIISSGYTNRQYLLTTNYWTGERIAATLPGLISSVIIGYSFYGIVCQRKKYLKLITAISLGAALYLNMKTASRTPILLVAIVWIVMIPVYIANQRGRKSIRAWGLLMLLAMLLVSAYTINAFGIRDFMVSLPVYDRFLREGFRTGRGQIAAAHFSYMFDYLWGGSHIRDVTGLLAHNYIQEGHDLYGVFATFALCLLEVSFAVNFVRLIWFPNKSDVDYLLISMYFSMLAVAHLEPIFSGYSCYFFSLLLIHGMANGYIRTEKMHLGYCKR